MKRFSISKGRSGRRFRGTVGRVHRRNLSGAPMRGGIRL